MCVCVRVAQATQLTHCLFNFYLKTHVISPGPDENISSVRFKLSFYSK